MNFTLLTVLGFKFNNFSDQGGHTAIQAGVLLLNLFSGFPADLCLRCAFGAFRIDPQEEPEGEEIVLSAFSPQT